MIVRPPEVAFAPRDPDRTATAGGQAARMPPNLDPARQAVIAGMMKHTSGDMSRYANAVRDWAAKGADSQFVLPADEVIARSRPRRRKRPLPRPSSSSVSTSTGPATSSTPCPTSRRRTASTPRTGAISRQAYALVDESMGDPYGTDLLTRSAGSVPRPSIPSSTCSYRPGLPSGSGPRARSGS